MKPVTPMTVVYYSTESGACPFDGYLDSLKKDKVTKALILSRIRRVKNGNLGDCARYGPITELRNFQGPGYRIYIGEDGPVLVVLLTAGDKSTQPKDLKRRRSTGMTTKREKPVVVYSYESIADKHLKDHEVAFLYLQNALHDDGIEGFMDALRDVIRAQGNISQVSKAIGLTRPAVYKILSKQTNPNFETTEKLLGLLGGRLGLEKVEPAVKHHPAFRTRTSPSRVKVAA
jgi:putative addiction module killer protein/probable addiction module antidote protein